MIDNVADPGAAEALTCADFERGFILDRRAFHSPLVRNSAGKLVPYTPQPRTSVTGITLHQTACDMGERAERYDTISVHYVILRSGRIVWTCDVDRILYGGNGWNNRCIQIEVNGLYAGLEDDPDTAQDEALRTTWDDPTTPTREHPQEVTPAAMLSLRMLVRYLKLRHPSIVVLCAHRQASANRRNDPGQRIWSEAVRLHAELGMQDGGIGFTLGDGLPIPEAWDPRCKGERY